MKNRIPGLDWENMMHRYNPFGNKKTLSHFPIDFNWLEGIIHKSIDQTFSSQYNSENPLSNPSPILKETDEHLFIQIQVPRQTKIEDIRIFLDTNKLKVIGINPNPLMINLPSNGTVSDSEVVYNQQTLKMKITKTKKTNFEEIKINRFDQRDSPF